MRAYLIFILALPLFACSKNDDDSERRIEEPPQIVSPQKSAVVTKQAKANEVASASASKENSSEPLEKKMSEAQEACAKDGKNVQLDFVVGEGEEKKNPEVTIGCVDKEDKK